MVHGLASQMRGMFRLSSRPGDGTTAELWLPAWTGPVEAAQPHPSESAQPRRTGTVLLADDHPLVRESTAEMLSELGYEVVQAGSGEEAAELVEGGLQVDLLVTDHLMEGMTGIDLARVVRQRFPAMPVLLISGYSDPSGIPTELACLKKPFRTAALREALSRLPEHEGAPVQAVLSAAPIAP
jgi:CheY-like chemotaxis protein